MSDNAGILREHLAAENNHDLAGTLATVLLFVVFVDFRDGLLAGERFQYDLNGLLRQLGQPHFVVPGEQ